MTIGIGNRNLSTVHDSSRVVVFPHLLTYLLVLVVLVWDWNQPLGIVTLSIESTIFLLSAYGGLCAVLVRGRVSRQMFWWLIAFALAFYISTITSSVRMYSAFKSVQLLTSLFVGMLLADRFFYFSEHITTALAIFVCAAALRVTHLIPINVNAYRLLLLYLFVNMCSRPTRRPVLNLVWLMMLMCAILLENTKALLGAAFVVLLWTLICQWTMMHLLQVVGIVLIVVLTLVFMPHELVLGRVGDLVDPLASNTTLPRLVLAYSGLMAFADHPFVGVGIGAMNHPDVFFEYYQAGIIPVYSTGEGTVEHTGIFDERTSGVHNMYVDVFASGGILLGLLFLGYLWQAFLASSHDVIKRRFLVAFLMYAMSWQFFSVSLGAFIIGLFFCCLPSRFYPGQGAREDL